MRPSGPCAHEVTAPFGGATPVGTVVIVAAGGWLSGSSAVSSARVRADAQRWRAVGYQVVAIEHTSGVVNGVRGLGPLGHENVVEWYDLLRWYADLYFGSRHPVCVSGGSSGGHSALLLALERRPDCIVVNGAPTDLRALKGHGDGSSHRAALRAFGAAHLSRWSPAAYPKRPQYRLPIAMAHLPGDPLVPPGQLTAFSAGRPTVRALALEAAASPGPECTDYLLWISLALAHLCEEGQPGVSPASVDRWRSLELELVRSVTG